MFGAFALMVRRIRALRPEEDLESFDVMVGELYEKARDVTLAESRGGGR